MSKKIFILGVGCQKGGTTWLSEQLKKSDQVNLGFAKEYHVFDSIYIAKGCRYQEKWAKSLERKISAKKQIPVNLLKRLLFVADQEEYYEYFHRLWDKNEKTSIVGDITPSYSGLQAEHLKLIKQNLERFDFRVKVIFLLRDPLERIWSNVRMLKRKRNRFSNSSDSELILNLYKKIGCELRTRYNKTMMNLERVFEVNDIFYCLYEDLFSDETFKRIASFLEIDSSIFIKDEFFNQSKKVEDISDSVKREVVRHYTEVYKFADLRFSVQDSWKSYKFLDS
jgi:hypothetical protein